MSDLWKLQSSKKAVEMIMFINRDNNSRAETQKAKIKVLDKDNEDVAEKAKTAASEAKNRESEVCEMDMPTEDGVIEVDGDRESTTPPETFGESEPDVDDQNAKGTDFDVVYDEARKCYVRKRGK